MRRDILAAAVAAAVSLGLLWLPAAHAGPLTQAVGSLPEASGTGSPIVVYGTGGSDLVTVHANGDGSLVVTVKGRARTVAAADVPRLIIDGGAGDDRITVDAGVAADLMIFGGPGDDAIVDLGSGDDFLDGGPGSDTIQGGTGADLIFGGSADDALTLGGAGGAMAGGPGADSYAGGTSSSRVFAQRGEADASPGGVTYVPLGSRDRAGHPPGYLVHVSGTAAFRQRVAADLTDLLSLPNARRLLTALDDAGRVVTVTSAGGGNETTIYQPADAFLAASGAHGSGSASTVAYNPLETTIAGDTLSWQHRPPLVGLYHELVHALNAATGTMQPGRNAAGAAKLELQAIGLSFKGIAFRWSPRSPARTANPAVFTENGMRALLGLPRRTSY